VGVGLPVGLQGRGTPRRAERVLGDDVLCARGLSVVHDVGRIGLAGEQRGEDLAVQAPPGGDRHARPDCVPRQLVPEAHVAGSDLEQLPSLGLLRRSRPARHDGVQQRGRDAVRHDRDELDQVPRRVVEP
jgi:hypothetical protein